MRMCSSALPVAADMSASERLAVRMMLLAVLLVGIASEDLILAMIIVDGISFITHMTKDGVCYRTYGGICFICHDVNSPDGSFRIT